MWQFIPRLPGKIAWVQRPFQSCGDVDDMVRLLQEKKTRIHGILVLKGMKAVDELVLTSEQWMEEADLQAPFGNTLELKSHVDMIKRKSMIDRISKVYLHDMGYFIK
jgi:hypothetical protein